MTQEFGLSQARMHELLEQELAISEQLLQILAAEKKSITDGDIHAFEEVINRKRLILERFNSCDRERISLLDAQGITHNSGSMDEYLKRCPGDTGLMNQWQRLLSLAADCRNHNRQNHQLVGLFSEHTSKALHVLRGESVDQNVYGPDGDTSDPHDNHSLGIV